MIVVKCKRGPADRLAPDISDPMIASVAMATARGKRFLDDPEKGGYYLCKKYTLGLPHISPAIVPGRWISVTCAKLGFVSTRLKVRSYSFGGDNNAGIWATAECEKYE